MTSKTKTTLRSYKKVISAHQEKPDVLLQKIAGNEAYSFLLESGEKHEDNGRYSCIGYDPLKLLIFPVGGKENPLNLLREEYENYEYIRSGPVGGLECTFVGYFSYELVRHLEEIELSREGLEVPEGIFFLPRKMLIFDHLEKTITLKAFSESDLASLVMEFKKAQKIDIAHHNEPQTNSYASVEIPNSMRFQELVRIAQEKIKAGEIFQVVLSKAQKIKTQLSPIELYKKLKKGSPSPYMYYLHYPDFSIIGSSPETLVKVQGDTITVHPIAGTRQRGADEKEDARLAEELIADEKERAEHMMLVDLGRNDVGRVSEPGSVTITKLMQVEKFSHVMHLVSEICGTRKKESTLFDIFSSAFPAGTLTGAPKIRAMNIIAELEETPRGIYGGAVGYFDLSGNMDFAIAIRTLLYKQGEVTIRTGAGIVYDSIPLLESQECDKKARGPLTAFSL